MVVLPELRAHQQWLGLVQPVGLVVSAQALTAAQAFVDSNIIREQQTLMALAGFGQGAGESPCLRDFPAFCRDFLRWKGSRLAGGPEGPPLPESLCVALREYGETLVPTYAVADRDSPDRWLLLIKELPRGTDLDAHVDGGKGQWQVSQQARFERLLRETDVPTGLLVSPTHLRLVYAPRGESSGHITFPIKEMCEVLGRPMVAALHMLLASPRLFTLPPEQRLPALLKESRKFQNEVSTALAAQVLEALHELLRGFQAADDARRGELLGTVLREAPDDVYGGLLTTLMRLVFILYAEERGLLPAAEIYQRHYSITGLFERLREDNDRYPDTMDDRYGAWPQLIALFRLIHDGGAHAAETAGGLSFPPRSGKLFDPDGYPFLEGRPHDTRRVLGDRLDPPRVPDGVVYRVLEKLLVLKGERLSYRALDVEQIGSVYEAMMGFTLTTAKGPSVAVTPHHVVVDLAEMLETPAGSRAKLLKERAGCEIGKAAEALKAGKTVEDIAAALGRKLSPQTPRPLPPGSMVLQPTEERR